MKSSAIKDPYIFALKKNILSAQEVDRKGHKSAQKKYENFF